MDHPENTRSDWRWTGRGRYTTQWFDALRCPFEITLETTDTVPAEYRGNAYHFTVGQEGIPFTRYYINFRGAKLAVSNYYGVWFEVQKRDTIFEAKRVLHRGYINPAVAEGNHHNHRHHKIRGRGMYCTYSIVSYLLSY